MAAHHTSTWSLVIAGPTAVGKTSIALRLAERLGAEILGADAMQIYRGLEPLTAAPSADEQARVPHHCVGVIDPSETCDVVRYYHIAREALQQIQARKKPVVIVGGTGLYIRVLTHGLEAAPAANPGLREELAALSVDQLRERLSKIGGVAIAPTDVKNPRRLARAIEKATALPAQTAALEPLIAPRGYFLTRPRVMLVQRIQDRTRAMVEGGAVEAVRRVGSLSATAEKAIGIAAIREHLDGRIERHALIEKIALLTRQYAKRQMTWFRRETWLETIDLSAFGEDAALEKIASQCIAAPPHSHK